MELGRLFRKNNLAVSIGKTQANPNKDVGYDVLTNGICASACAYAFLGGASRSIGAGDKLGFHQFSNSKTTTASIQPIEIQGYMLSSEQLVSGVIADYIVEMGVDARVLAIASSASKDDLFSPSDNLLRELRIVSTPSDFNDWKIDLYNNGIRALTTIDDTTNLERGVYAYCTGASKSPVLEIDVQNTAQNRNPEDGAQYIRSDIWGINIYVDDHTNKRKDPISIPLDHVVITAKGDLYAIVMRLPEGAAYKILDSSKYEILVDSSMGLFNDRLVNFFITPDKNAKRMLELSWSVCGN